VRTLRLGERFQVPARNQVLGVDPELVSRRAALAALLAVDFEIDRLRRRRRAAKRAQHFGAHHADARQPVGFRHADDPQLQPVACGCTRGPILLRRKHQNYASYQFQ
jgi:hypothetical protein